MTTADLPANNANVGGLVATWGHIERFRRVPFFHGKRIVVSAF